MPWIQQSHYAGKSEGDAKDTMAFLTKKRANLGPASVDVTIEPFMAFVGN